MVAVVVAAVVAVVVVVVKVVVVLVVVRLHIHHFKSFSQTYLIKADFYHVIVCVVVGTFQQNLK